MVPRPARELAGTLLAIALLAACGGDRSSGTWGAPEPARSRPTIIDRALGEAAILRGPEGVELGVSVDFTSQPPVPATLSPEQATFLEVHLTVTNSGDVAYVGVLSEAADLAVVPGGTLGPVSAEAVPQEIALSGGYDFSSSISFPPGAPPASGRIVFRIDPDADPASFSLTIPGARETIRWSI